MKSFAEIDIEKNGNYLKLLSAVSKLSGLFKSTEIVCIIKGFLALSFF